MKALHFGAGNIGRGFIGKILHDNGYSVTFADIDAEIIDALNEDGKYTVHIAEEDGETFEVTNVAGVNTITDDDALKTAILEADLITTAVGVNILPVIAKSIAPNLAGRGNSPLNIIACENAILATDTLKAEILKHTDELDGIGFPNSAVDRIVPIQKNDNLLDVKVEPFYEWVIEKARWIGDARLDGVTYVENLIPFIERKLFTVNTGHAAIAYYGKTLGFETVSEAMTNEKVEAFLKDVLNETMLYLTSNYDFTEAQQLSYIEKIIARFKNPHLSDDLDRVGRGVMRKLSAGDRIMKPLIYLEQNNLSCNALTELAAYALEFNNPDDPEVKERDEQIAQLGMQEFLTSHSHLNDGLIQKIKEYL
ncbi:mannitol-1-phosphate 5-dehydrogenase [Salinicoccus jeotgali]|uniref:Mannitol-1-phosphate 5-dehydrogenase n=1 Tax=Salinicoccus jeotgali TaxID=381634 RepID=A0ABP7E951_9STAP